MTRSKQEQIGYLSAIIDRSGYIGVVDGKIGPEIVPKIVVRYRVEGVGDVIKDLLRSEGIFYSVEREDQLMDEVMIVPKWRLQVAGEKNVARLCNLVWMCCVDKRRLALMKVYCETVLKSPDNTELQAALLLKLSRENYYVKRKRRKDERSNKSR